MNISVKCDSMGPSCFLTYLKYWVKLKLKVEILNDMACCSDVKGSNLAILFLENMKAPLYKNSTFRGTTWGRVKLMEIWIE